MHVLTFSGGEGGEEDEAMDLGTVPEDEEVLIQRPVLRGQLWVLKDGNGMNQSGFSCSSSKSHASSTPH